MRFYQMLTHTII